MPHPVAGGCSLSDALFDQLEQLISHKNGKCPTTCPECKRLDLVMLHLDPFREKQVFSTWRFPLKDRKKKGIVRSTAP